MVGNLCQLKCVPVLRKDVNIVAQGISKTEKIKNTY
jgi:hypothetical protein